MFWQLSVTFVYEPMQALGQLGHGNRWCESPEELDAFREFVNSSPASTYVSERAPARVELDYFLAE
jgi:hypothetical protein